VNILFDFLELLKAELQAVEISSSVLQLSIDNAPENTFSLEICLLWLDGIGQKI
jgi:hypothetical protein